MECLALKSSLREEFFSQLPSSDDAACAAAVVVTAAADDYFAVDELLDLSNESVNEEEEDDADVEKRSSASESSVEEATTVDSASLVHAGKSTDSVSFPDELGSVPTDDLEELEWLSHFVDDSFSEMPPPACNSAAFLRRPPSTPNPNHITTAVKEEAEPVKRPAQLPLEAQIPARCRTKRRRVRPGPSPTTSTSSSSSSYLIFSNPGTNPDMVYCIKPSGFNIPNRPKETNPTPAPSRRCSHCLVQKTPQWRTGPLGSKTLCNACGVRYKSGRLLPEYRPATSPTFVSHIHSNSHRKVLEMRRKKELVQPAARRGPGPDFFKASEELVGLVGGK